MNGHRLGVGTVQVKMGTEFMQGDQLISCEVLVAQVMIQRWKHIQKEKGKQRTH